MGGGPDPFVSRYPQGVLDMLAGQHREQRVGFGAFAYQHDVGRLRAEQQPTDASVTGDGPHDVGHACTGLLVRRRRGHRGPGGDGRGG